MGKANQLPTLIITLDGDSKNNLLRKAVVKNRFGPQDATGRHYDEMLANPASCFIDEKEQMAMIFDSTKDEEWVS